MEGDRPAETVRFEGRVPPHLRRWVALVLRGGVLLSSSLLVVGLVLWGVDGAPMPTANTLGASTYNLAAGISSGSAFAFLLIGLLALVLTPLAREVVALVLFARARDRPYIALTAFVLVVLLLTVLLGLVGFHL